MSSIGNYAFSFCPLTDIIIPNSVTSIGDYAFYDCSKVTKITSYAVEPPLCSPTAFSGISTTQCKLVVPEVSGSAYRTAEIWKDFSNIDASLKLYTIRYIVDGVEYATEKVPYNSVIALKQYPTKEGYTFSGWNNVPETMPAYDVTVTGQFVANTYQLLYIVDGEVYASMQIQYGSPLYLIANPTKTGYTFSGWSEIPETMPAHDVEITGEFTPIVLDLSAISTAEELVVLANNVNSGEEDYAGDTIILASDIDLSDMQFAPIGTEEHPFRGYFDGRAHTLTGKDFSTVDKYAGLFGYTENATVQNVTVDGFVTGGVEYTGGIVGYALNSTIHNCQSSITISSGSNIGGIVGYAKNTVVSGCGHTDNQIGNESSRYIGGIAGYADASEIYNCFNRGKIYGTDCVGGIAGYTTTGTTISNCFNKASFPKFNYIANLGGIVGYNCGSIYNSYNSGTMTGSTVNGDNGMKLSGGVVGYNHASAVCQYCYFLKQAPINTAMNWCGDLNWATYDHCGEFNGSGALSSSSISYGNTTYLDESLNNWVNAYQTTDYRYKSWTAAGWPEFTDAHKLTYIVDGRIYKVYFYRTNAVIKPETIPSKTGYIFGGWSEIPETMPAYDVEVTGEFASGISTITVENDSPFYNLQGIEMKDKENLPAGIYIQNGKKIVVK